MGLVAHDGREVVALAGHPPRLCRIALDGTSAMLGALLGASYVLALALVGATALDTVPSEGAPLASLLAASTMGGAATGAFAPRVASASFERRGRGPRQETCSKSMPYAGGSEVDGSSL